MPRLRNLTIKDVDAALDKIANYYRKSRLYLDVSNTTDAYEWYKNEYREDTAAIIEQGHSYEYKGQYLIALDLIQFYEEHPEEAKHYFGIVPTIKDAIEREAKSGEHALFICAFGPKDEFMDKNSYDLIELFVSMCNCVVLTDCATGYDIQEFHKRTTAKRFMISGIEYWRWAL